MNGNFVRMDPPSERLIGPQKGPERDSGRQRKIPCEMRIFGQQTCGEIRTFGHCIMWFARIWAAMGKKWTQNQLLQFLVKKTKNILAFTAPSWYNPVRKICQNTVVLANSLREYGGWLLLEGKNLATHCARA